MKPERINIIIAESQGWTEIFKEEIRVGTFGKREFLSGFKNGEEGFVPDYYASRDALQPVLDGLTEEQKSEISSRLWGQFNCIHRGGDKGISVKWFECFLAPPNSALAVAVVKALGKWEE